MSPVQPTTSDSFTIFSPGRTGATATTMNRQKKKNGHNDLRASNNARLWVTAAACYSSSVLAPICTGITCFFYPRNRNRPRLGMPEYIRPQFFQIIPRTFPGGCMLRKSIPFLSSERVFPTSYWQVRNSTLLHPPVPWLCFAGNSGLYIAP